MIFKILICDKLAEEGIQLLKNKGYEITKGWEMPKEDLVKIVDDYDALIIRSATKVKGELLKNAKQLKVIGRAGIGLDNIDLEKTKERGIIVVNTPTASANSVAELTIGHMLSAARGIVKGTVTLRDGKWVKKELKGVELTGKTLGLIGYGNIAKIVEKVGIALGLNVLIVRSQVYDKFISLEEMLPKADFISIHIPLTIKTKHLLSTQEFNMMKDGVIIVDCSRGRIVDQEALYQAISTGKVKAAAVDVFEEEPPGKNKLLSLDNFSATPHIGAQTSEAQLRAGIQVAEKVIKELDRFN